MGRISGYIRGFGLCIFLVLGGCKIHVAVPAGGSVETTSGSISCASGRTCEVNVADTDFDEHFIAVPDQGYYFKGWKKRDRGFCGGSKGECYLSTTGFPGQPALLGLLSSDDEVFYLEPEFVKAPDDWIPIDAALSAVFDYDLRECIRWASGSFSYAEQLETLTCAVDPLAVAEDSAIAGRWFIGSFQGIEQFRSLRTFRAELSCLKYKAGTDPSCAADFAGMEKLQHLQTLIFYGDIYYEYNSEFVGTREGIDVGFLSSLSQLQSLELPYMRLASMSPIGALTNLREFDLRFSYTYSDVGPLRHLTKLRSLNLHSNRVDDLSILQGMTMLRSLDFSYIQSEVMGDDLVREVASMASMANLTTLKLRLGEIVDISPLSHLKKLEVLHLSDNQIKDISAVAALPALRELRLIDNPVGQLIALEKATRLEALTLTLTTEQRDQVWYLRNLDRLKELRLSFMYPEYFTSGDDYDSVCELPDGSRLRPCDREAAQAYHETFADYSFLRNAHDLEILSVRRGGLEDISFLRSSVNLKELHLAGNGISDASPLRNIKGLEVLDLNDNGVYSSDEGRWVSHLDLTPLSGLVNLTQLRLAGNGIETISPLRGLDKMRTLNLGTNSISTLDGVLYDMPSLVSVLLWNNPINCQELLSEYPELLKYPPRDSSIYVPSGGPGEFYYYSRDNPPRLLDFGLDKDFCS